MLRNLSLATVLAASALAASPNASGSDRITGDFIVLNDNGGWSWFQDNRAVIDKDAGKLLVSSVADGSGTDGAERDGDVDVISYDLASGEICSFVLHDDLQDDDHNSAALWIRPDGRYLAMYSTHGGQNISRYRLSSRPADVAHWEPEQTFDNGAGTTYANLHYVPANGGASGLLYQFTRTRNLDPNIVVSYDHGESWSYGGKLLTEGKRRDRPYLRYASNGREIHFICTERHPRDYENSIYHGYIEDSRLYNTTGQLLDATLFDGDARAPAELTPVFRTGDEYGGVPMHRAWTIDIALDDAGLPYAVFQARANDDPHDHRYFYARFDGAKWTVYELAKAGGFLYAAEADYTGLVALDPANADRLYVSTKIDPRTDVDLSHYEIFQGTTADGGATWRWSPVTYDSTVDNLRPIVPKGDENYAALLWLRGVYTTFRDYDLDVVGLIGHVEPTSLGGDR